MNRLTESYYEVTDTFSYYLSLHKPDHNTGIHFHIPQTGFKSNSVSLSKLQKVKLIMVEKYVVTQTATLIVKKINSFFLYANTFITIKSAYILNITIMPILLSSTW